MSTLSIELPENLLLAVGQSREEFLREAKVFLVVKLFEMGRLSSGKAAELCAMRRGEFLRRLGDLDEAELAEELCQAHGVEQLAITGLRILPPNLAV